MNKSLIILVCFSITLLLGLFAVILTWQGQSKNKEATITPVVNSNLGYESKSAEMGEVEVKVTPNYLKNQSKLVFALNLNTHSVELNYDFTKIAALSDDKGNVYKSVNWTGETGGHHLSGNLVFDNISPLIKKFKLELIGIDNRKSNFEWDIKGGD